ncbi:MAG TPA: LuxR C-terminal-related transcriptional regulator [Bacteroidia bacterium]
MQFPLFIRKNRSILLYGVSMAILLLILKWLEWKYVIISNRLEIYIGAIALIFTLLGIWLAKKLTKPKTLVIEKEVVKEVEVLKEIDVVREIEVIKEVYINENASTEINKAEIEKLGLSNREMEVLQLMSTGLSNQEIADKLFLSLPTIKTHTGNIFIKLDVKRRTQAVEKAKRLNIIT